MTEVHEIRGGDAPLPDTAQFVAETAKAVAEQEFNRAERFDRKALNLATVIGAFFSLSQIVVVNVIDQVADSKHDDLRYAALIAIGLSAISVGFALLVFAARREYPFPIDKLPALLGAAGRDDSLVIKNVVTAYRRMAESRAESNKWRARFYITATIFGALAVAATAAELGIALYAVTN
jgi:hypothetical protein